MKGKVTPSLRVTNKTHEPWVCLPKGKIELFLCTGLGEDYSDVVAIIFKIETAVVNQLQES